MVKYKTAGLFAQLALPFAALLSFLFSNNGSWASGFLITFAIVQLISILVNLLKGRQLWKSGLRKYHIAGTALVLIIILIAIIPGSLYRQYDKDDKYNMQGLNIILFATIPAILLSLLYIFITWIEWKRIKHKVLIHLK